MLSDIDFMYHDRQVEIKTPMREVPMKGTPDPTRALYAISVAGELTGVDPQMLRAYEARGLVTPARTEGGTRRYSGLDLDRIQRVTMYLDAGLNLAGIERVFALEAETDDLRDHVRRLGGRPRHRSRPPSGGSDESGSPTGSR